MRSDLSNGRSDFPMRHVRVSLFGVCLCVLATAGCGVGEGPNDPAASVEEALCAGGPTLDGIDVSSYQGTINWASVKGSGKVFANIRVAHGLAADTHFATNWTGAKSVGMVRGAYAWLVPTQSISQQAAMMIQAMSTLGPGDLPPTVDVEEVGGMSATQLAAAVQQWMTLVHNATGRTPMIYSGSYFWDDYVKTTAFNTQPLWVPNYGVTCPRMPAAWTNWTFHQYSSTGSVPGISGNVDLDKFNGTLAQLQALGAGVVTTTGILTGAIYEGTNTSARLGGVAVSAGGLTVTTGADGLYSFTLPPGNYTANTTKAGYGSNSVMRTVTAGATVWGSMGISVVSAGTGVLAGTVSQLDNSQPIAGATVTAAGQTTMTGATGQFSFTLAPGPYTLTVSKTGFETASLMRSVTAGTTVQAPVALSPTGTPRPPDVFVSFPTEAAVLELATLTVVGTVGDASGSVHSIQLSLNGTAAIAVSVTDGKFSADLKLRGGANQIALSAKDAAGNTGRLTRAVTFRSGVSGTVVDAATSSPVAGASVTLLAPDGTTAGQQSGSTFSFDVDPGDYVLVTSATGFVTRREAIGISDEMRMTRALVISAGIEPNQDPPSIRVTNLEEGATVKTETIVVEGTGTNFELSRVKVDGVVATVLSAGSFFSATVPLKEGANTVEVIAFGTSGAKATTQITVNRKTPARGCSSTGGLDGFAAFSLLALALRRRVVTKVGDDFHRRRARTLPH